MKRAELGSFAITIVVLGIISLAGTILFWGTVVTLGVYLLRWLGVQI